MPPKSKYTREEIVAAALKIAETDGLDLLTARTLGRALGSSPRPIFTVFDSMEEVKNDVLSAADRVYGEYVTEGLKETPAFRGVGKAYIRFAAEKPKLFQLLFMREIDVVPDIKTVLGRIESNYEIIIGSVENGYNLSRETALKLYRHLWIYSHGIAVLIATKVCSFSGEEISSMLTEVFVGLLTKYKSEGKA